ncbi:DUF930 domain-containing protein [Sinorhizobium meliloti]|nr:DUF930 domain-containing protein [Sinorhizobium meliloti]
MRALACAFTIAIMAACPTQAMDRSLVRQFEKLDPQTRLEQRCDTEAMERIGADKNRFKPDKVIAYTFADPVMKGDKMKATGAVFRSNGDWYKLAFRCKTDSRAPRSAVFRIQDRRTRAAGELGPALSLPLREPHNLV